MLAHAQGRRPPFNLSGSWETGLEGWSGLTNSWGTGVFRDLNAANARTGSYVARTFLTTTQTIEYVVNKSVCAGLTITASVWAKRVGTLAAFVQLRARIGSGSAFNLGVGFVSSASYVQLSGSFVNAGDDDVTIIIELRRQYNDPMDGSPYIDDWSISGA